MQTLQLRTGRQLPAVGMGLWKVERPAAADVIVEAAKAGHRHFDSACDYGNEAEVGAGLERVISSGLASRDDLWVTSKLWNTYHRAEHVRPAVERSLADLKLDYLDLYLVHFPIALKFVPPETRYPPGWFLDPDANSPKMEADSVPIRETWQALEELVTAGLVRDLGVCNFNCALLRDLVSYAQVPPAVLQVELHPYLTQEKLVRYCRESDVVVTAFSPLGALSYCSLGMADKDENVLANDAVHQIAQNHDRSPAQITLRWGLQRGTAVIPKTSNPQRMRENLALFDFELSDGEMTTISSLNRQRRFNDPGHFCEAAFNTFFPIYE